MASFLSVLKAIGRGIETFASLAAPALPEIGLIPVAGPAISAVVQGIVAMEKILPQSGVGAAKKAAVTAIANAAAPGLDQATLSTAIDEIVAALNQMAAAEAKLAQKT